MAQRFQDIIAPLDEAAFRAHLNSRTPVFCRGTSPARFEGLLTWPSLLAVFEQNQFPPDKLRLTQQGQPVPSLHYLDKQRVHGGRLTALLDRGVSIIAAPLDPCVPALAEVCRELRTLFGEDIYAGAIVTTGTGGALKRHFDDQDLIILQCEGSKRWRLYGPPAMVPRSQPLPAPPDGEPVFDENLEAGDFLFLPAGYWHECENGPGRSLHVGLFFEAPTGFHAFKTLVSGFRQDELFRAPLTRLSPAERAAHESALKQRLIDAIEANSLTDMLAGSPKVEALPE